MSHNFNLRRGLLPDDIMDAVHPPELSGVLRVTSPLGAPDATGLVSDWAGVELLLSQHLLQVNRSLEKYYPPRDSRISQHGAS